LTKFDQGIDQTKSRIELTITFTIMLSTLTASIPYFTGRKRTRNEGVMSKTAKNGPIIVQILLSVVDKIAYLGGSICTQILSNRRQLGPQVETFKQESHFNYDMQLPDR
jgi:hypothetical protein